MTGFSEKPLLTLQPALLKPCVWVCVCGCVFHCLQPTLLMLLCVCNRLQLALICCVCFSSLQSRLTVCDLWTVACQALLSMGFSLQEYWIGLPFPSPSYTLSVGNCAPKALVYPLPVGGISLLGCHVVLINWHQQRKTGCPPGQCGHCDFICFCQVTTMDHFKIILCEPLLDPNHNVSYTYKLLSNSELKEN